MTEHPITVRLDQGIIDRVEAVAATMSKRAAGVDVKRGTVLRVAVERGLSALEAELGIKRKR